MENMGSIDKLRKEIENRAGIVVRGLADPRSGWYGSPDDLQAVIEGQLAAMYEMGKKSMSIHSALRISEALALADGYAKSYSDMPSVHDDFSDVAKVLRMSDEDMSRA